MLTSLPARKFELQQAELFDSARHRAAILVLEHFEKYHSHHDGIVAAVFNRQAYFFRYRAWRLKTAATYFDKQTPCRG